MINPIYSTLGDSISLDGYAIDYGKAITEVQFSLDEGKNWTSYETSGATNERWVHWNFKYTPEQRGHYVLKVRSKNEDCKVSPEAAYAEFFVY